MGVIADSDPRLRVLASPRATARPEFVLYWCQAFRRPTDNLALAYAIGQANQLGLPCVVYEAIRPDYPHASDRFHTFVLEGARDMARALESRGLYYAFFTGVMGEREAEGGFLGAASGGPMNRPRILPPSHPPCSLKIDHREHQLGLPSEGMGMRLASIQRPSRL